MERGNVLVIGNSGVGKSTLINAVLGEDIAKTGWGSTGTTSKLEVYESKNDDIPFRIIDTIGFQPSLSQQHRAIRAVKQWSNECAKKGKTDNQINVIWFCVDGTSSKLFPDTIKNLTKAASMWKSVPVIVVITKSYSILERKQNIQMVHNAFATQKRHGCNLREVIPVVAASYALNETAFAEPDGITELINTTNDLLPEGLQAAKKDLDNFVLNRKRFFAQSVVTAATTAGIAVGLVPITFSDAALLTPTEAAEINSIARIYGINKDEKGKRFLQSIVDAGTVSAAAKTLISALKAIPGINLGASVINAVIAGVIVFALGEGSIYAFEQIYRGNKSTDDIDWVKKLLESKLSLNIVEKAKPILEKLKDSPDPKAILKTVMELIATVPGTSNEK